MRHAAKSGPVKLSTVRVNVLLVPARGSAKLYVWFWTVRLWHVNWVHHVNTAARYINVRQILAKEEAAQLVDVRDIARVRAWQENVRPPASLRDVLICVRWHHARKDGARFGHVN